MIRSLFFLYLLLCGVATAQTCPFLFCSSFEANTTDASDFPQTDAEAAKFLTQATFGPTYASVAHLRKVGYTSWLAEQKRTAPSTLLPQLDKLIAERGVGNGAEPIWIGNLHDIWFNNVLYNDDQLRQRVAFALSQMLVVSSKSDLETAALSAYYDILVEEAFGNYRDVLERVTLSPAMGRYLSMLKNRRPGLGKDNTSAREDLRDDARPDENYAREIMQLFSVGLVMLNQDGTEVDGNASRAGVQAVPTYTQEAIKGFAHVFTGWNYGSCNPPKANPWHSPGDDSPPFIWWHWDWCPETDDVDAGGGDPKKADALLAKRWRLPMKPWGEGSQYGDAYHAKLGTKQLLDYPNVTLRNGMLPAGGTARSNMKQALDNVFNHPNVPPFVAFRLIQRLTTSNPSPAYVKRVADVFVDNGRGVRGDLGAVVNAILLDPEARDPSQAPAHFGKVREPIIRVANLFRAFNGESKNGGFREGWIARLVGQMVLDAPSVFNYYLPDYQHAGIVQKQGLYSPVLQMMTDSQISTQAQFLEGKVYWGSHLGVMNNDSSGNNTQLDFKGLLTYIDNPARLVDEIDLLLTYGTMSSTQKQRYINMMRQDDYSRNANDWTRKTRIANVISLTINSPAFIVEAHQ